MNSETLLLVGDYIMLGAAVGAVVFAISYAFFFQWTKTAAGRALLAFVVSLDLVFVLNLLGRFLGPEHWGREPLRIIVYTAVFASVWGLVITLWRNYRRGEPTLSLKARHTGARPKV